MFFPRPATRYRAVAEDGLLDQELDWLQAIPRASWVVTSSTGSTSPSVAPGTVVQLTAPPAPSSCSPAGSWQCLLPNKDCLWVRNSSVPRHGFPQTRLLCIYPAGGFARPQGVTHARLPHRSNSGSTGRQAERRPISTTVVLPLNDVQWALWSSLRNRSGALHPLRAHVPAEGHAPLAALG